MTPIIPQEGWIVQHLFYTLDHGFWAALTPEEKAERMEHFDATVQKIRSHPKTQLLSFSMVTPKFDLGFMLLTPDLQDANQFEKELTLALGPEVLTPAYCYLSMTEWTEYSEKEEEASERIARTENLEVGSEAHTKRLAEWKGHMDKYYSDRLYPNMPDWQVMCFYPMSKRRNVGANWYAQDFAKRRELMSGHARTGRKFSGKVRQLITGSTGLDTHEWGVTLFAHDIYQIKTIVYEMRWDEVTTQYGEFGDFYIGIQLNGQELFQRLLLA
ncbi:chlorite dismutase [Prosthecobacter debontii]|uniref:Chlorite dismutase n=1 Tax=Prosthecobacter debontii TaxID=48467 RepID=A0A1T4YZK8_9BACT|nr:hydrogen peroxide-dependent heme synthase [Prosthecobacter debontii]SKB07250.1 chlorite dismutase [Prosthecobacter debontii]